MGDGALTCCTWEAETVGGATVAGSVDSDTPSFGGPAVGVGGKSVTIGIREVGAVGSVVVAGPVSPDPPAFGGPVAGMLSRVGATVPTLSGSSSCSGPSRPHAMPYKDRNASMVSMIMPATALWVVLTVLEPM